MNIGSICSHRTVCASTGASLSEVVALMYGERVGSVIVTAPSGAHQQVVGIITDRDIVRQQVARLADFSQLRLGDVMTPEPLVVRPEDEVAEVLQRLRARGVRRAPVVDANGTPVGLVSLDDLLQHAARQIGGLAALVARQAGPLP